MESAVQISGIESKRRAVLIDSKSAPRLSTMIEDKVFFDSSDGLHNRPSAAAAAAYYSPIDILDARCC
jgi:hypothetical protein